jgi:predicted transcriptional regulator
MPISSRDYLKFIPFLQNMGLFLNKGYIEEVISYVVVVARTEHYRRLKIIAQILTSAQGNGAAKTELMYGASLSNAKVEDYLSILIDTGLLEYDEEIQLYRATDKGMHFLIDYKKLDE